MRRCYDVMYHVLVTAVNDKTQTLSIAFTGTFARLDYLCRQMEYRQTNAPGYRQICRFRGRSTHLRQYTDDQLRLSMSVDLRALCQFLAALYGEPIPSDLRSAMAPEYPVQQLREPICDYMRMVVTRFDSDLIYMTGQAGDDWQMPWRHTNGMGMPDTDHTYLRSMLTVGTQLNLVHPYEEEGLIHAQQVIYEPDLLIEISTLAHAFGNCGPSPYSYILSKLEPNEASAATLLGNFASQMLDEEVHSSGQAQPVTYQQSVGAFFTSNALNIASCHDLQQPQQQRDFHTSARVQQQNLRHIVGHTFAQDRTIDLDRVVLEPSFYCEVLGLQGRMDLLQSDKHVLMEQKSGKMDEYRRTHKTEHFVQVLLYQAMLHYAYRDDHGRPLRNDDIASYLLYSRYPEGLIKEAPAPLLLADALRLRNQMAYLELALSRGDGRQIISHLTPDTFNVARQQGTLWLNYIRPRIAEVLDVIHRAAPIEQDYFYRLFTFVAREHILSKVGTSQREASGFAALWNSTVGEKREAGNLIDGLRIVSISPAHDLVTLSMAEDSLALLPNFREGDIVVMYAYPSDADPDARRDMVFRASVAGLTSDTLRLRLRAPQKNLGVFGLSPNEANEANWPNKPNEPNKPNWANKSNRPYSADADLLWAVEHDFTESSQTGLYRSLFLFLQAEADRRRLLLSQRQPRFDMGVTLRGDYGAFNRLVLQSRQAQDYFLLIGPPGTGKTSCGLVNILSEELGEEGSNVLLVSYTNRAVDEICSKLEAMGHDYLRIGSDLSCADDYRPRLLSQATARCASMVELRNIISQTRIIVGTTSSVTALRSLFALKRFDLCIIDEASQILEPHLLGILSARHGEVSAVRRFVMIGDHKQLPAVVQQTEAESRVSEESLRSIGLLDCRQSLFERLLRTAPPEAVYMLSSQGRMHHDVAAFANESFYEGRLTEVPLVHQQRPIPYRTSSADPCLRMLCSRRVSFIDVRKEKTDIASATSDKVNQSEAQVIARIVEGVCRLYAENGLTFDVQDSVGVIVPYRHQISTVRKAIERLSPSLSAITIDTVERFQGSQRDVIVYGFTVSRPYQLAFLANNRFEEHGSVIDRKLNVAMTRARELMLLVGDADLLRRDEVFARVSERYAVDAQLL
ncbi:MAG: ATP-binding protein [Bacteroidales bacterium]|nr:ATP-binding protein [Candidatus Liminaster caballi]